MKRVYPLMLAVCICMAAIAPRASFAQCQPCSGGAPPTAVPSQIVKVDTSNASVAVVTFQKFYDATGTQALSCVAIEDTISIVSGTGVKNTSSSSMNNIRFTASLSYTISGPGTLTGGNSNIKSYGPYNLGPIGSPTDNVMLGPDTIFNNERQVNYPANPAPYFGIGTVNDTVSFGGGTIASVGTSYTFTQTAKYWGVFKITYYWCPQAILATSIKNFTATQNGNSIILQWLTDNEQNNINYEIQISTDGKQFTSTGQAQSDPATAGSTSKYQYQYNLDQANVGKLYFRIKHTDASGKVSYSTVLVVSPGGSGDESIRYQAFPNPATNSLIFQFNSNQTGRYLLELINTAGQVVQQKSVTLTGTNQIRLDLSPHPSKGLYYLRTQDLTHNQHYTTKVLIN